MRKCDAVSCREFWNRKGHGVKTKEISSGLNVCVPPTFMRWSLTSNVMGFGGAVFANNIVMKVEFSWMGSMPSGKGTREPAHPIPQVRWQVVGSLQLQRGISSQPNYADALISDFHPPGLWEVSSCCFKASSVCYFVIAAQAKTKSKYIMDFG